jgi:hypothetical protein
MSKAIDKIEKEYRLPCGPMAVTADAVCRRRLKDSMDKILDRLSEEIHPEYVKPEKPKGERSKEEKANQKVEKKPETLAQKKKRMLEEGKVKMEVKKELKSYEEQLLEGNSKLLQDTTGTIKKR